MGAKKQNPRGVTIRKHKASETINITFTFKGVRCREPLSLPVTQSNINYAGRLLGEIQNKIERNTFNYADYFPTSSRLRIFGKLVEGVTIKHYLDEYIETAKVRQLSPSTIAGYQKVINELSDFHKVAVNSLTPAMIKNWIKQQRTKTKTIRNKLSVLRSAIDEAVTDGILQINPVSQISVDRYKSTNKTASQDDEYEVDPFTPQEIELILDNCRFEQWRNLFKFALRTGLRSSELCALRWIDIDFKEKTAHVQKAKVVGVIKGTKTKSGTRLIELDDVAINALQDQLNFTRILCLAIRKQKNHGLLLMQFGRKHGFQQLLKLEFVIETPIKLATPLLQCISLKVKTYSGSPIKWGIKDRKCCSVTMVDT